MESIAVSNCIRLTFVYCTILYTIWCTSIPLQQKTEQFVQHLGQKLGSRSATGLPLTHGQTVGIETSICFCQVSSGRLMVEGRHFHKGIRLSPVLVLTLILPVANFANTK